MLKNVLGFVPRPFSRPQTLGRQASRGRWPYPWLILCLPCCHGALACPRAPPCLGCRVLRLLVAPKPSGPALVAWAPPSSYAGHRGPLEHLHGCGDVSRWALKGPRIPQAAPRASTASNVTRSATVPTVAGATASMGPASVTRGSTAASATWVSPLPWWPVSRGRGGCCTVRPSAPGPCCPHSGLGVTVLQRTWGSARSLRWHVGSTPGAQSCVLRSVLAFRVSRGVVPSLLTPPSPTTGLTGRQQYGQRQATLGIFWGMGLTLAFGVSWQQG